MIASISARRDNQTLCTFWWKYTTLPMKQSCKTKNKNTKKNVIKLPPLSSNARKYRGQKNILKDTKVLQSEKSRLWETGLNTGPMYMCFSETIKINCNKKEMMCGEHIDQK